MKIIKDNKLLLKIISALIAIVLWFAITYTEDPTVTQLITNLNTVFFGESNLREQGLIVVNKDDIPALSAVIRGNRSKVISSLDGVFASIDVSGITEPGTHEVFVEYRYPSNSVTLTKTKVSMVSVDVEKILSRDIPVKIKTDSEKDSSLLVVSQSNTEFITVRGAQSVVEKIEYAMTSADTSDITISGTTEYSYNLYDKDDNILSEENIISKSRNTVSVTSTVYTKTELPVEIVPSDSLKESYTLKVKKQSISNITVGLSEGASHSAVYVVLDEDVAKESGPITLDIPLPADIYSPDEKPTVTIEFELLPKSVHELEVSVSPENVPVGREVTIDPEKVKILVKCAENDASASKITATINAEELEPETEKNVTLNISADENISILGTYTVTATLH